MTPGRIAILLAFLVGCASGTTTPGPHDGASLDFDSKATIVVDDSGIHPDRVQVRAGEAVTVTNRGSKDHGLTSSTIETGTLRPGESTTVFLTAAGTVELHDRTDSAHVAHLDVAPETSS